MIALIDYRMIALLQMYQINTSGMVALIDCWDNTIEGSRMIALPQN
jgi:hypothetical protein